MVDTKYSSWKAEFKGGFLDPSLYVYVWANVQKCYCSTSVNSFITSIIQVPSLMLPVPVKPGNKGGRTSVLGWFFDHLWNTSKRSHQLQFQLSTTAFQFFLLQLLQENPCPTYCCHLNSTSQMLLSKAS